MEPSQTNDKQEFVTASKRNIFIALTFSILLFLFSLYSFLQGGWFIFLGIILVLALCSIIGYIGFLLVMLFLASKATIVEHDVSEPIKLGRVFSRRRSSLVFKSEEKDTQTPLD